MSRARLATRLARLNRRRPAAPPASRGDPTRLTAEERAELAAISAKYGPLPRLPSGKRDLSSVSDDDLDALVRLYTKMLPTD